MLARLGELSSEHRQLLLFPPLSGAELSLGSNLQVAS